VIGYRGTDHGASEERNRRHRVERLNALRELHEASKAAVLRASDARVILHKICETALSKGGFGHAAIGLVERASGELAPVAWADVSGLDLTSYRISVSVKDQPAGESTLTAQALQTRKPAICHDTRDHTHPSRYRKRLLEHRLLSAAVLPVPVDDQTDGVLILSSFDAGAFGDEELALLGEVAIGISLSLRLLRERQAIEFLSSFDSLTGLPNRELFCKQLESTHGAHTAAAILLVDLIQVSGVNDTYGRTCGDHLLRAVAGRLRTLFPDHGTIAHFGAGTFAITLLGPECDRSPRDVLTDLLNEPFTVEGIELRVTARVGSASSPRHGPANEGLVQHAEAALKQAKQSAERWVEYAEPMNSRLVARLTLEQKLRRALERDEFSLHYQPKLFLKTETLHGVEALLRWRTEGQWISPARFIPVLEGSGMIEEVGYWVFERAARDSLHWRHMGLRRLRVAVNVSPLQLRQPDFLTRVAQIAGTWARQGLGLDLEITESAIMTDVERMVGALEELSKANVLIALDDFGTGYSSLSLLAKLPLHQIKIDRSFIAELGTKLKSTAVVEAMIRMAHTFGMQTIAEGIETAEQLGRLRALGCDVGQGYLFSRPVSAQELPAFLAARAAQRGVVA
jgi:diguanylate cyclase (GGDEF)-like protein